MGFGASPPFHVVVGTSGQKVHSHLFSPKIRGKLEQRHAAVCACGKSILTTQLGTPGTSQGAELCACTLCLVGPTSAEPLLMGEGRFDTQHKMGAYPSTKAGEREEKESQNGIYCGDQAPRWQTSHSQGRQMERIKTVSMVAYRNPTITFQQQP